MKIGENVGYKKQRPPKMTAVTVTILLKGLFDYLVGLRLNVR